ncbi:MAG: hypothetical protein PVG39_06200 [Desulfobacteraceae bacterium]|jgi:hypothetical protein
MNIGIGSCAGNPALSKIFCLGSLAATTSRTVAFTVPVEPAGLARQKALKTLSSPLVPSTPGFLDLCEI